MPRVKAVRPPEMRERIQAGLAEIRIWRSWELGRTRCPYCIDLTDMRDWLSVCDCFMAQEAQRGD